MPSVRFTLAKHLRQRVSLVRSLLPSPSGLAPPVYTLSPTALGLTTIQNLRTASSPGLTRLVLDLDAKARPSKHPQFQAEGVTIEIPNATLSPSAKTKLAAGKIAKPFIITQSI